jgi:hypothetical protein
MKSDKKLNRLGLGHVTGKFRYLGKAWTKNKIGLFKGA